MAQYILAHDLGTTGNKAHLFDAEGALIGSAFAAYPTAYPQANWAEQDPEDWWQAVCNTTRQLLAECNIDAKEIAAIGFSGQMMGCVPIDREGNLLRSCIIWADQRAQPQAEKIAELCTADALYASSGHRASPAYSAAKILWLRDNDPEIYARTACFLQPKDYIVYRLTGARATDYSDASGTLLFDLETRSWNHTFLHALDIAPERLPQLHRSTDIVGVVSPQAAAETGLAAETPVVIGGGDGACAGVGAGVVNPGETYCNIGSSAWISMSSARPILDPQARTFTFHHLHPDYYCPMGTMQAAGGARDWAWRLLQYDDLDLDAAAAEVAPSANGLIFLPYLLGERSPHWNPLARGAFVGLEMAHQKPELARAVLEGVALNLRLILDTLAAQVPTIESVRLIGGGGKSTLWPQLLADCFKRPIHQLTLNSEATAWGAAVAAGVGVGLYPWQIAGQGARISKTIEPTTAGMAIYDELVEIYADTYSALEPIYERLARLQNRRSESRAGGT